MSSANNLLKIIFHIVSWIISNKKTGTTDRTKQITPPIPSPVPAYLAAVSKPHGSLV